MTHWHSLYRRFIKCYFVVCGLKCNFCISDRSWEDCGKLHGEKGSMKYYLKGCLSAKECQSFELDSKCGLWYCKVICCKGDLWNGDRQQYHWPAQWWSSSLYAIFLHLHVSRSRLLWDVIIVIKSLNFANNKIPFLRDSKSDTLLLGKVLTQRLFSFFFMKRSRSAWTCSFASQGAVQGLDCM